MTQKLHLSASAFPHCAPLIVGSGATPHMGRPNGPIFEAMRRRRLRSPAIRYSGPVKVIETTGPWGVYTGERIVLGDGRALDDDLGLRIRKAFEPDAARALERREPLGHSFELRNVEITMRLRRR